MAKRFLPQIPLRVVAMANVIATEEGETLKDRYGEPTHGFDMDGDIWKRNSNKQQPSSDREQITPYKVNKAVDSVKFKLFDRLNNDKGYGTFSSTHEILGVLHEEMHELLTAVHENASNEDLMEELKDIAVGATFAIACIDSQTLDW